MPKSQTAKEFKWNCPSCLTKGISSVVWKDGVPIGANITCTSCFWTVDRFTERVVDDTCRDIPAEYIPALSQPFWQCQACQRYNHLDLPEGFTGFTADDLYCIHCQTWQCDIPGHPNIVQDGEHAPNAAGDVSRSRWDLAPEEIVEHVELTDAQKLVESQRKPFWPNRGFGIAAALLAVVIPLSGYALAPIPFEAHVSGFKAETSVSVREYSIQQGEGWLKNAPRSNQDYRFIRSEQRKSGTILVPDTVRFPPDGVEHYTEEVYQEVGRRMVTEMKDVTVKVADGFEEKCTQTFQGAIAVNDCDDVPKYRYETKPTPVQVEVIDKDWVDVPRTRTHTIPQDVFDEWGWWEYGTWRLVATPRAYSDTNELPNLNLSQWPISATRTVSQPVTTCQIKADEVIRGFIPVDCSEFTSIDEGDTIMGRRSRLFGVVGELTIE